MSTPTYNKMASIAIGGTNINKVSTPNGNVSLDVTGNTNLRNNLYAVDTTIKTASLNALKIQNATSGQAVRLQFTDTGTGYNSYIENKLAGDLTVQSNDNLFVNGFNILYLNSVNSSIQIGALYDINLTCVSGVTSISASNVSIIGNESVSGDLSCGGNISVTGNETIGGTLNVTGNTTFSGTLTITGNTTLNAPLIANYIPNVATSNTMIGYTNSINAGQTFSGTASDTSTPAQVGTFTIPAKGVWFIQMDVLITLNGGSDTITDRSICLSETSASLTECAPGFKYSDPINDGAGSAGNRQTIIFSGVYHLVSSTTKTLYVNAIVATSGSRTTTVSGNYKYTRIA